MNLNEEIGKFLAEAEVKQAPSKLEPYSELLIVLRQRKWTFKQISTAMQERFGVSVAPSTIHNFLKVRTGRRTDSQAAGVGQAEQGPGTQKVASAAAASSKPRFHLDP
jgi:hypothetical protein